MASGEPHRLEPRLYRDAFLVFCTADLSKEVLNDFLNQAYSQTGVTGDLCVVTSTDFNSVTHNTVPPVDAFQSPFIGWSLEKINNLVEEHVHAKAPLSECFYAVLDTETAQTGKSALLVENVVERRRRYAAKRLSPDEGYEDGDEKVKSIRQSFEETLQTLSALEFRSMDMIELIEG